MVQIHARAEWADITPSFTPARRGVPDVFLHHEGGAVRGNPADKARVLREIEHGVLGKGYIAIDYDLMVFQDGSLWEGRGFANEDAATIHNNPTSQSICAVGNFQREVPTPLLVEGIAQGIAAASAGGWVQHLPHVRPHQSVFATACPGANLLNYLGPITARATALITGHGTTPDPNTPTKRKAIMDGFFWSDPETGGIYYCDFSTNTWLNQPTLETYTWILAAKGVPPEQLAVGPIKNKDVKKLLLNLPTNKRV